MANKEINEAVKLCIKCNKVKSLEFSYYRAGKSWQKLCKLCHNARRTDYKVSRNYIMKPTGFLKLPEELQKKIIYDVYVRVNYKDISRKYAAEYNNLVKHQSLLRWARLGQIPAYETSECFKQV